MDCLTSHDVPGCGSSRQANLNTPCASRQLASGISQHGSATEEVAGLLRVPDAPRVTLRMSVTLCHDARDTS